ncbi:ketoacyl-ACP synthase III [Chitinibacter sp. ZOR0017]|uniref:ketoacyl-ACP synthase III n=1 Tax=Chitinibacter sp. ZOR0017 TaxID=1339254 RepID=UPI000647E2D4|nr:ketoacyl-ACP synthase III [Chitinibacter sp. ZOR0017]
MDMLASNMGKEVQIAGARIAGIVACVPKTEICNDFFHDRHTEADINDVIKMIGVKKRRWVTDGVTTHDLCLAAAERLLEALSWDRSSIDAIIFVSQTPDYVLPATACSLQAELGLPKSCIAFDVNLGCSGYPYALWLGMTLIQSGAANRVLLAVGDTISNIIDPNDRSTVFLFGDAGTITALESSSNSEGAFFVLGTDGSGVKNLIVPQGGFKNLTEFSDERFVGRKMDSLYMDGGEIFNFTLKSVPPLVNRLFEFSSSVESDYDYFLFHQANLFMLKHLAKKAKLPLDKVPINIDSYGNTSSASIPLLMVTDLKEKLLNKNSKLAMFGFGVGYSWAACSISVGDLKVVEMVEL